MKPSRMLLAATAVALVLPAALPASDMTFRAALNTWSNRLSADAASVGLAAKQRHPRLMTTNAIRFHRDALKARVAISAQRVTSPRLRRARQLALSAFPHYARAGTEWAASGHARLSHDRTVAIAEAKAAARDATAGSRLLLTAAKVAR